MTTRPGDLVADDFSGCDWVFLSCYSLYSEGLLPRAVQLANQVRGQGGGGRGSRRRERAVVMRSSTTGKRLPTHVAR